MVHGPNHAHLTYSNELNCLFLAARCPRPLTKLGLVRSKK